MASRQREVMLDLPPEHAFALARSSAYEIPSYRCIGEDPAGFALKFSKGFGWTNPMELKITAYPVDTGRSVLRYEASILALADPFGFMNSTLDQFIAHMENHRRAWLSGTQPAPPPKNNRPLWVNVGCIAIAFALIGGFFLLWLLSELVG
jgi:hypothetical protein